MDRLPSILVAFMIVLMATLCLRSDSAIGPTKLRVVFLGRISADQDPRFASFSEALTQLPSDLQARIELRYVTALLADRKDRLPAAIDEALALQPHLLIAPNPLVARTIRHRQLSIPVIFSTFLNPVRRKVVTSTLRRDEPFAGVWVSDNTDGKRLEILHDAYPSVKTVAVLMDRDWGEDTRAEETLPELGARLGLKVTVLYAEDWVEAEEVLARPDAPRFDAWCLPPTGLTNLYSANILQRLQAWRKAVIVGETRDVLAGAPLSYMVDENFRWTAMADLTARVLQGEPAGSIPIQRPLTWVLAVRPIPAEGFPPPSAQVVRRADVVAR